MKRLLRFAVFIAIAGVMVSCADRFPTPKDGVSRCEVGGIVSSTPTASEHK